MPSAPSFLGASLLGRRFTSTTNTMKTGTKKHMSCYPEGFTDGGLRLENIVPDFSMETTHGNFNSFHEQKKKVGHPFQPPR